jgi:hypothetical protein
LTALRLSSDLLGLLPPGPLANPNPPQLTKASNIDSPMLSDVGYGVATIDGKPNLFTAGGSLGPIPGDTGKYAAISDNGVIAFVGNNQGHGIYAFDPRSGQAVKVIGDSAPGTVDANGALEPITHVDDSSHIGIEYLGDPNSGLYEISFMADSQDRFGQHGLGLHTVRFAFGGGQITFLGYNRVVNIGETIPGVGTVNAIQSYDEINSSGQLAFWVQTGGGEAIVRATPPVDVEGNSLFGLERLAISKDTTYQRTDGEAVAHFLPSDAQATAAQFNATVDWGDGKTSPGTVQKVANSPLYEVVADHTYEREGPYVITVRVADTKNQVGGIGASLAYIGNVTSEEDIQHLADENTVSVEGGVDLSSEVHLDRVTGQYSIFSKGMAGYKYSFQLDTVNGDGINQPSSKETGKGGKLDVTRLDSSGTFNGLDFSSFNVQNYDVTVSGQMQLDPKAVDSREFGDKSTSSTSGTITYSDTKTDANNQFTWDHTEDAKTHTDTTGTRYVDRNTSGEIDGLIRMNSGDFAAKLASQGQVGAYTTKSDTTSHETIHETGDYGAGMVDRQRHFEATTHSEVRGGNQTYSYQQTQDTTTVSDTSNATISLNDGSFTLHVKTTTTIDVSQTDSNQTLTGSETGSSFVETDMDKTGNNHSGDFNLVVQITTTDGRQRTEINQSSTVGLTSSSNSTYTENLYFTRPGLAHLQRFGS